MMRTDYRHLDIVRHRSRRVLAPYLLIVQHHDITSKTKLSAPLVPPNASDRGILAPRIVVDGMVLVARILDIAPVPLELLGEVLASAEAERDAIRFAVDTVLNGDNMGRAMLRQYPETDHFPAIRPGAEERPKPDRGGKPPQASAPR
jgi:hypothetical protein